MINRISSFVNSIFGSQYVNKVSAKTTDINNPFASSSNASSYTPQNYVKNNPVPGGYFRGYHNGKPNIVGSRLLVDV